MNKEKSLKKKLKDKILKFNMINYFKIQKLNIQDLMAGKELRTLLIKKI